MDIVVNKVDAVALARVRKSIGVVPWGRLAHAYNNGALDAPKNLELIITSRSRSKELEQAIDWMWGCVLHQGSIYSATTPFLSILVDLLREQPNHPAAPDILYALQAVADAISYASDEEYLVVDTPVLKNKPGEPIYEVYSSMEVSDSSDEEAEDEDYFTACIVTPALLRVLVEYSIPVIRASLEQSDKAIRTAAVAAGLGVLQVVSEDGSDLNCILNVIGDSSYDPGTWISAAMVFGELGENLIEFLKSDDRRIRLAASMSASTASDARSVEELAAAIAQPEWLEQEFPNGAAHVDMHLRFHVLGALLNRVDIETAPSFVIDSICVLIKKKAGKYTVDAEWGRVLTWAFKERLVQLPQKDDPAPLPDTVTRSQGNLLNTLFANDELWLPSNGNASLVYARIQLPYDRDILKNIVEKSAL